MPYNITKEEIDMLLGKNEEKSEMDVIMDELVGPGVDCPLHGEPGGKEEGYPE